MSDYVEERKIDVSHWGGVYKVYRTAAPTFRQSYDTEAEAISAAQDMAAKGIECIVVRAISLLSPPSLQPRPRYKQHNYKGDE